MKLHREGRIPILITIIILIVIAYGISVIQVPLIWKLIMMLPFVVMAGLILWFFRIPPRKTIEGENTVIAPADGKIVVIEKVREEEYFKDERIQISIFMSPLNVHQNVFPVSGKVLYRKYHPGKYLVAWHPKSSTENERSTLVIGNKSGTEILVRQIAGAVARRIRTYAAPGQEVTAGEELGFIKFGSRVDVFLPLDSKIVCQVGDITKNKLTSLAEL